MSSSSCIVSLSILLLIQSPASSEDLRLLARALPGKVKSVALSASPDTVYAIAGASIVSFVRKDSFYAQLNLLDLPEATHALTTVRGPDGETLLYAVTEHAFLTIRSAAGILTIE
jgi:hypothetical protein